MPFKSFYRDDTRVTPEERDLSIQAVGPITALFKEYIALGYSPREISHVLMHEVWDAEMTYCLDLQILEDDKKLSLELVNEWGAKPEDLVNKTYTEKAALKSKLRHEKFMAKLNASKEKKETQQTLCL